MKFLICVSEPGGMGTTIADEINGKELYGDLHDMGPFSVQSMVRADIKSVMIWAKSAKIGDIRSYNMGIIIAINDGQVLD